MNTKRKSKNDVDLIAKQAEMLNELTASIEYKKASHEQKQELVLAILNRSEGLIQ